MKKTMLPASATIFGTTHFPAIDNQGAIGSCASQAFTRNQFTNAYSRYMHSIGKGALLCPRDNRDQTFAPKFTFTLSGAGTAWVYETVKDHGALCFDECAFEKNEQGGSIYKDKDGVHYPKTNSWPVKEGQMERALNNRITGYKQYWFTQAPWNEKLTTCEAGRQMIVDIKKAILRGDCVVTGGYPGRWVYAKLDGCGDIGGPGEAAVVAAAGNGGGGHQVTIVGYDDNVTATFGGVKLKGAFQVANSYGEGWQNKGLCWLMYDACNTVSEFDKLNDPSLYSGPMYLTPEDGMSMFPVSLTEKNQEFFFEPDGSCTFGGKDYPAFYAKNGKNGDYLAYRSEKGDRSLFLSKEKSGRFAFIPYKDLFERADTDKQYYKDEYADSCWIYAADKEEGENGYRMLDAGTGFSSSGRKVSLASLNAARYPEAKSWLLGSAPKGSFTSRLAIAAGKDVKSKRIWVVDQFVFLDWTKDVTVGMPELYAKATISANDRDCFKVYLTRKEKGGAQAKKYLPAMFRYAPYHPIFADRKKGEYLNFEGKLKGDVCTGYFAFSFLPLMKFPKGKTAEDYEWGIELKKGRKGKAALLDATLCNADKKELCKLPADKNKVVFKLK